MNSVRQQVSDKRLIDRRSFLRSLAWSVPALSACPLTLMAHGPEAADASPVAYLASRVDLRERSTWTDISPQRGQLQPADRFTRLTVHHAGAHRSFHVAAPDVAGEIENILGAHQKRHFGDIGYHFIIDRAGRVWEGRSTAYTGAHVSGENEQNIGVMLLGNFEYQLPSSRQLDTLHETTTALRTFYGIGADHLYGHCDLGSTLCPGRYLYGYVSGMKSPA